MSELGERYRRVHAAFVALARRVVEEFPVGSPEFEMVEEAIHEHLDALLKFHGLTLQQAEDLWGNHVIPEERLRGIAPCRKMRKERLH